MSFTITSTCYGDSTPKTTTDAPGSVTNGDFVIVPPSSWVSKAATPEALRIGDGINEETRWTFDFTSDPLFSAFVGSAEDITSAKLTLWLKAMDPSFVSDTVSIDGLDVIGDGEPFQSNIFNSLSLGNVVAVDLALRAFYSSSDILGIFDGSPEIPPGRIPMVYSDDAVVCRASLALTRGESSPGNGGSVGPMPLIPPYPIYNPWWWIETHGGTGPGPGPSPWARQLAAAMALAFAANKVAPKLQASVLEIALQQMSIATAALKKDLKVLRKK